MTVSKLMKEECKALSEASSFFHPEGVKLFIAEAKEPLCDKTIDQIKDDKANHEAKDVFTQQLKEKELLTFYSTDLRHSDHSLPTLGCYRQLPSTSFLSQLSPPSCSSFRISLCTASQH